MNALRSLTTTSHTGANLIALMAVVVSLIIFAASKVPPINV